MSEFHYGGQAVIEGVMMRGKQTLVTAVRRPNGEIGFNSQPLSTIYKGKWKKIPFVRGVIALIESMVLGISTLMYSANVALEEEQIKLLTESIGMPLSDQTNKNLESYKREIADKAEEKKSAG